MNVYLLGLLWVAGAAVVAGLSAYLVRRLGQDEGRPGNNDAAGQVFTIISGLQAVLIAFVLISLFDKVSEVEDNAAIEMDSLIGTYWAIDALPDDSGVRARQLADQYARTVVEVEWPRLRVGDEVPDDGEAILRELRGVVANAQAEGTDEWASGRKTEAATQLRELDKARQERLAAADDNKVNTVVWFALIAGAVITTLLPNLFGGTRLVTHVIIVSTLAATVTLLLFAIQQLQNPFSGGAKVNPDPFTAALTRLQT